MPGRPKSLARYTAPGDGPVRDKMLAVIDAMPASKKRGFAIWLAVDTLDTLARVSLSPTQTRMAASAADILREYIPADLLAEINRARAEHGQR